MQYVIASGIYLLIGTYKNIRLTYIFHAFTNNVTTEIQNGISCISREANRNASAVIVGTSINF